MGLDDVWSWVVCLEFGCVRLEFGCVLECFVPD